MYTPPASRQPPVVRQSLLDALDAGSRVTLIAASAGSGKTSLMRAWAANDGVASRAAWVTVARGEDEPHRFWLAVIAALRETDPGKRLVGPLSPAPGLAAEAILERLLDDLTTLDEPLWLIIDDLHELASAAALDQLTRLVAQAPADVRFVLSTRRDLRLGLHRLRLGGELTEIRSVDLQFAVPEARALFNAAGVELSRSALDRLVAKTEGWAAGLRLAALSLVGHPDPERFTDEFSGSDRTVAEYLLGEVLDSQEEPVRRLLLRTSILEQVTGPLADRMTGNDSGARILDDLERSGAFVVAIDAQRTTFRYHRLFADLLELELQRDAPDEVAALHVIAAEWFAEHRLTLEAVRHAQAARRWDLAGRLLSERWTSLYLDGRRAVGRKLLDAFPPQLVTTDPELTVVAIADELASGSLEEAGRLIAVASRRIDAVPEARRPRVVAMLSTLSLSLARQRNDVDAVAAEAARLRPVEGAGPFEAELDDDLRALALETLGIAATLTGDPVAGEGYLRRTVSLTRRIGRPYLELGALTFLGLACGARSGELAEQHAREAIAIVEANGWQEEPVAAMGYLVLGVKKLWRGRLSEAEYWLDMARRAAGQETEPATGLMLEASCGRLELARGNPAAALRAFRAAMSLGERLVVPHVNVPGTLAHLLLAQLRSGEAESAADRLTTLGAQREMPELRVAAGALALARGEPQAAIDEFGQSGAGGLASAHRWRIQALLIEALAHDALGDAARATRALEAALDVAEPEGLILPFVLVPARELLERHARSGTAHTALLTDVVTVLLGRTLDRVLEDVAPLSEPLSEAELRILRYLPTNLRVPEIAAALFVSPNTARTHIRRVYQKLGVHDRGEAVLRGRSLGLLSPGTR